MIRNIYIFITILCIIGCKKENNVNIEQSESINTMDFEINFPTTVFTHKKYKGRITFYNSMLDTIAIPRRDTSNFRFIIYKPFEPYLYNKDFYPIYKDSILLDKNTVDIEYEFDKPGIYNIGGFARDAIRINYHSYGRRDSARFIEHKIVLFHKVVVRDSI